jgi:hypothetical protein
MWASQAEEEQQLDTQLVVHADGSVEFAYWLALPGPHMYPELREGDEESAMCAPLTVDADGTVLVELKLLRPGPASRVTVDVAVNPDGDIAIDFTAPIAVALPSEALPSSQ